MYRRLPGMYMCKFFERSPVDALLSELRDGGARGRRGGRDLGERQQRRVRYQRLQGACPAGICPDAAEIRLTGPQESERALQSVHELLQKDAEDESLRRYKEQLLGSAAHGDLGGESASSDNLSRRKHSPRSWDWAMQTRAMRGEWWWRSSRWPSRTGGPT